MNMENVVSYSPVTHSIISHVLFGVAAHLCGLMYFLVTNSRTAPHYRTEGASRLTFGTFLEVEPLHSSIRSCRCCSGPAVLVS